MSKKKDNKKEEDTAVGYSIIMIGDSAAGKTSLVERYLNNTFEDSKMSTIGFEKYTKKTKINDLDYKFDIMDTTGQERYASLGVQYFRNCDGAILVYDVSMKTSYNNIEHWLEKLTESNNQVPFVVFENKIDKPEEEWQVSRDELKALKDKLKTEILSVSAKTGANVEEAFLAIEKLVIEKNKNVEEKIRLKLKKGGKKNGGGCC